MLNKLTKLFWFGSVFLGAIGFSLALLVARVFFKNAGLVDLVSLQTDTAFIAFLIQAGARAGLRKEYLIGHKRLVNTLELFLCKIWPLIFVPVSVLMLLVFKGTFLPLIYALNAIITLLTGLSLVRQDVKRAGLFSTLLFVMNFGSGVILIVAAVSGWGLQAAGVAIESVSLLLGLLFVFKRNQRTGYKKAGRLLGGVLYKYLGLQVSSFIIMFSVYIFAQLIIGVSNAGNKPLIVMYSDAILISGLLTLVLSRVLMVFEQKLVNSGKVETYVWIIHVGFIVFTVLASLLRCGWQNGTGLFFLLLLGLLGRFSIALVSGYIDEKWRKEFLVASCVLVSFQGGLFLLQKTNLWQASYLYYAAAANLFVLSFILIVIYKRREGVYISNRSAANTARSTEAASVTKKSDRPAGQRWRADGPKIKSYCLRIINKLDGFGIRDDIFAPVSQPPPYGNFMMQQNCTGVWLSLGDFLLSYLIPLAIYCLIIGEGRGVLVYPELTLQLIMAFVAILLLFLLVAQPLSRLLARGVAAFYELIPLFGRDFHVLFALIYVVLATIYLASGLSFNRYDGVAASEELGNTALVTLVFCCKIVVSTQVFYCLALRLDKNIFGRFYWWSIFCALLFTIDGMAHIMLTGLVLWLLLSAQNLYNFLSSGLTNKLSYKLYAVVFGVCLFVFGLAFKAKSFDVFIETINSTDYLTTKLAWLMDRVSTLYFSAGYAINHVFTNPDLNVRSWGIAIDEFRFRFCLLTGGKDCWKYKQLYGSMSRFNLANISVVDPGRGGASPGVVGSAFYLFPMYLAPWVAIFYYSLMAAFMDTVIGPRAKGVLTLVGMVVYGYLLRFLYLNPAALLNPLSMPLIGILVFLFVSAQFFHLRRAIDDEAERAFVK